METFIALFRGINVGGYNILPMHDLRMQLEKLGLQRVQTYIQSGNVVFRSSHSDKEPLTASIRSSVNSTFGFDPLVMLLTRTELDRVIAANPFPAATVEPAVLHAGFLDSIPHNPDLRALEDLKTAGEQFMLGDRVFYLLAPGGIGRSRLAARAERLLGVDMTDRNWKTVLKLAELAGKAEVDN